MDSLLIFFLLDRFFSLVGVLSSGFLIWVAWRFWLKRLVIRLWSEELKPVLQYLWAWWIYDLDYFNICVQTALLIITTAASTTLVFWHWPSLINDVIFTLLTSASAYIIWTYILEPIRYTALDWTDRFTGH